MYTDRYEPYSIARDPTTLRFPVGPVTKEEAIALQARYRDEAYLAELRQTDPGAYRDEVERRLWIAWEQEHPGERGMLCTADGNPAHFYISATR